MSVRRESSLRRWDLPCLLLSSLVLAVCVCYSYLNVTAPDIGFELDPTDWVVVDTTAPPMEGEDGIRVGDQVLRIGTVTRKQFEEDRTIGPFRDVTSKDQVIPVTVSRGGALLVISQRTRGRQWTASGIVEAAAIWIFPLSFWLMGTIAVILLRPRDQRWLVLVLFNYVTALWTAPGLISSTRMGYSEVVFHLFVWFFVPLSIHLHLILPDQLFRRGRRFLLPSLYIAAAALLVLDFLHVLPPRSYIWPVLLAITTILGLLIYRNFRPASAAVKMANRLMLFGAAVGLGPVVFWVGLLIGSQLAAVNRSVLVSVILEFSALLLPLWPLTYILALYKHHLGNIEFRANRLLGLFGFLALYLTLLVATFVLSAKWVKSSDPLSIAISFTVSVLFVAGASPLRRKFQALVDRHVFGIRHSPSEIVSTFASRIPTASNRGDLNRVIREEILPALLIRQSALYLFFSEEPALFYEQNVPSEQQGGLGPDVENLFVDAGRYLPAGKCKIPGYDWVRLIVPLAVPGETIGVWLLGKRDPDDFYSREDIEMLTNLANQMAAVIGSFRLVQKAQHEVAENKRLQQQLFQSQKAEALGRLAAGVAHDFNNLLAIIFAHSEMLAASYPGDENLGSRLSAILAAARRAADLTKQLLAFSRQEVAEIRVMNLNSVIIEVTQMLSRIAGEEIEVVTDLSSELPNVKIDPGQMSQVIINLAVNARDAMPRGGRFTIATSCLTHRGDGAVDAAGLPPGEYVIMRLSDMGSGMAPEVQARIFEPFFTTKEVGKGTGLGLSVVFGIIKQFDGHITVDSTVGEGTTINVYLPAVREEAERWPKVPAPARPERTRGTILLAEDEDALRMVVAEILAAEGYTVLQARNGAEGVKVGEHHQGRIDLLLSDVVMPEMRGPELAERLTAIRPEIKVMYMSGYPEEATLDPERLDIRLPKPFSPRSLVRRVREVLDADPTELSRVGASPR